MYSYSSSSMSLYGRNTRKNNIVSTNENRPSVANRMESPKSTPKKAAPTPSSPPRSPFCTPDHPLYMFGDDQFHNSNAPQEFEPPAPQKPKNCLASMQELSLSSPREERPSPFRRLKLSSAFDEQESSQPRRPIYQTPGHDSEQEERIRLPHRVIRKSTTFGMERIREMSIDSPLERKLSIIEGDLEGEDGLARRLRRMKRRLFLEHVSSAPSYSQALQEQPIDTTPKHSNATTTMEGMEVVLEDDSKDNAQSNNNDDDNNGFYLTFSSSSESLQMDIDPASVADATSTQMPLKILSGDSSVVTEATAACSTFGEDSYWASLSSISEH